MESADQLRAIFALEARRLRSVPDRLAAIENGKDDPGEWETIQPGVSVLEADQWLAREEAFERMGQPIPALEPRPIADVRADVQQELEFTLGQARRGHIYYGFHDRILELLKEANAGYTYHL